MKKTKLKRAAIILIALILVFSSPLQVAGAEAEAQNAAVENVNETVYGVIKRWVQISTLYTPWGY